MERNSLPSLVLSLLALSSHAQSTARQAPEVVVPFEVAQTFGRRPLIKAMVNNLPVRLVLHSNAGFSMQLSHAAAAKAGITHLTHIDTYGIVRTGRVSQLGRDSAFVARLTIGGKVFPQVPVTVFETPSPFNQGMLGLRWLRTNRAVVDYRQRRVLLQPRPTTTRPYYQRLLRAGYVAVPMRQAAADGRYLVTAMAGRTPLTLVVSTVAENQLDSTAARQVQLPFTATGETYGGPTGTAGQIYRASRPLVLQLNGTSFTLPPAQVQVEDIYAYEARKRPTDPALVRSGMLGADFLLAQQAVIDFGTATLYLRK